MAKGATGQWHRELCECDYKVQLLSVGSSHSSCPVTLVFFYFDFFRLKF